MGWSYRKSFSVGPFRVNMSKSGVGYSVGGRGFRTGVRANGRRYTTASLPGTGLRYTKTSGGRRAARPRAERPRATGCLVVLAITVAGLSALAACVSAVSD